MVTESPSALTEYGWGADLKIPAIPCLLTRSRRTPIFGPVAEPTLKDVLEAIAALTTRVDRMDARVDRMGQEMNARFDRVDKEMDARFDRVDKEIAARFGEVNARFGEVNAQFAEVNAHFDRVHKEIAELDKDVTTHMKVHREIEKDIELLKRRPPRTAARAPRRR